MNQGTKIWKISLLLLFGLFVFLYVVASTFFNFYYLRNDPVFGVGFKVDNTTRLVVFDHVVPRGPAARAGVQAGDRILKINDMWVRSLVDQERAYESLRVGEIVEILIERDGVQSRLNFTTESRSRVYASSIFTGLLPGVLFCYSLCLIGLFVLLKKIGDKTVHLFYLMVLFWALGMWETFLSGSALPKFLPYWAGWLSMITWPIAVGLLLHFTLVFPVEKPGWRRHRFLYAFIMYGSVLLVIPKIYSYYNNLGWSERLLEIGWGIWFSVNFYLSIEALANARRATNDPHIAKQAGMMRAGTGFTLLLPLALFYLPATFFDLKFKYNQVLLLPVVLWPITLAYAIIKHRFMNINVIVKRGLSYAMMSGFVIAAYLVLVVGLGKSVLVLTGMDGQFFTIIATLIIAALFTPVKNRVQNFVDRRFLQSRHTYREAVQDFGHQMVKIVDLQTLLANVDNFLTETLEIESVVLLWETERGGALAVVNTGEISSGAGCNLLQDNYLLSVLQRKQRLLDLSFYARSSANKVAAGALEPWQQLKAEILLPLLSNQELRGVFALGRKKDGDSFYKEDIDTLQTLNDQINTALVNALLTEELREQARLKKELEVARRIQISSLPQSDPVVPGLDISGVSIPAYEVGGDYYDYLSFIDGRFGVVVGDVSGKGTSAALYMSQLKGILNTAAKFYKTIRELITEVNSIAFHNIEDQAYITLTCGAFDMKRKKFNLVRAGHLPLLHFQNGKGKCAEIEPRGIGIGLDRGDIFHRELEECEIKFSSGDAFVFYSDGLTEARNVNGAEFMTSKLTDCIEKNGIASAVELRQKIIEQVTSFMGDRAPLDDMTLVVVRIR